MLMGSGAGAVEETVAALEARGEKVGVLKVRLYRPFDGAALAAALPETVRSLAVLDRSKDPAAVGEPLYEDVVSALIEHDRLPARVLGGRYGLGSKEFTPAMAAAVFAELAAEHPKRHFTVGIADDVSGTSLTYDPSFDTEAGRRQQTLRLLRARLRRHRRREQELGEDHRRVDAAAHAGVLRLRLEEVGLDDRSRTCASARSRSAPRT